MKVKYLGFDIEADRGESMIEKEVIFYSVFRHSDGLEVTSGFSYGDDELEDFVGYLKDIVDDFLQDPSAYADPSVEWSDLDLNNADDCPYDNYIEAPEEEE